MSSDQTKKKLTTTERYRKDEEFRKKQIKWTRSYYQRNKERILETKRQQRIERLNIQKEKDKILKMFPIRHILRSVDDIDI